ncbi:AtpZ/AtpI family protein [Sorangium sp. So ce1153]|uniref:AtpZ/AtpI family protein n=1 Tax=Sorangium sp. So ce1153 TaxID=3133333 RepID=UPI003F60D26A
MTSPGSEGPGHPPGERDALHEGVVRFGARRRRWAWERGRSLGLALSLVGLGWLVVLPALLGLLVGSWLDARFRTGLVLRAGLGLLGLSLGCASAWRYVARQLRRGDRGHG